MIRPIFSLVPILALVTLNARAETVNFDQGKPGELPTGWESGVTGTGTSNWVLDIDNTAPSPPHILKQNGQGDFPWVIKKNTKIKNGFVEAKIKPLSGEEDQAGGLIWRFNSGKSYYLARINALENNVSLYYVDGGKRKSLKYVDTPVPSKQWHTLRVEFSGNQIKVILNGKPYIEFKDEHITEAGAVGLWTKSDSITAFDNFIYQEK